MTNRITQRDLDHQVRVLNVRLGRPTEPYTRTDENTGDGARDFRANPGCIYLSRAYGGVQVVEMTAGGGERELTGYHAPARETYTALRGMHAILDSIDRAEPRCAACREPLNVTVRGHHHTENRKDVTR